MQEMQETQVPSQGRKDPLKEVMVTHSSILLPEKSHEQRSLADYSPWGRKELHRPENIPQGDFCDHIRDLASLVFAPGVCIFADSKVLWCRSPLHQKKILP